MENEETLVAPPEQTATATENTNPTENTTVQPADTAAAAETPTVIETPAFEPIIATPAQSVPVEDLSTPEALLKTYKGDKSALYRAAAKEAGFDDFILDLNDFYKQEGSFDKYLAAKAVDWTKATQEELLAMKLKEEYSQYTHLPPAKIQSLIQHKLQTVYGIGAEDDDPESVEVTERQLKAHQDAEAFRTGRITEQQRFQLPQRPEAEAQPSPVEIMQAEYTRLATDEKVKGFLQAKTLSYGDYNHEVANPQETLATVVDPNRYAHHMAQKNDKGEVVKNGDGTPVIDQQKLLKVAAYVMNMDAIENGLIEHGKTLGKKQTVDEAEVITQNTRTAGSDTAAPDLLAQIAQGIMNR